jgi:hypothetical protein
MQNHEQVSADLVVTNGRGYHTPSRANNPLLPFSVLAVASLLQQVERSAIR